MSCKVYLDDVWEVMEDHALIPRIITIDNKSYEITDCKMGALTEIEGVAAFPFCVEIRGKNHTFYKEKDKYFYIKSS